MSVVYIAIIYKKLIKIVYIESLENLGCNFFALKKPCRKHTNTYRGLKVTRKHSAHAGLDSTRVNISLNTT